MQLYRKGASAANVSEISPSIPKRDSFPASLFGPMAAGVLRTLHRIKGRFRRRDVAAISSRSASRSERVLPDDATPAEQYLEGLKKRLIRYDSHPAPDGANDKGASRRALDRAEGRDWSADGETMIGFRRLDNLEMCIRNVVNDRVPGDLIECGVWRGGATIFMRAALEAFGNTDKLVWVADSFQGLPRPDAKIYPADRGDLLWTLDELAVSVEQVKSNFARYGLLDDRVRFLEGWFKDTLPSAPVEQLSVLRIDGDMYQSTIEALRNLYPKLAAGGYVIVDDYGAIEACAQAVRDYRAENGVTEEIRSIDWTGVYWRKNSFFKTSGVKSAGRMVALTGFEPVFEP